MTVLIREELNAADLAWAASALSVTLAATEPLPGIAPGWVGPRPWHDEPIAGHGAGNSAPAGGR
jgi:hypothetical protein